MIFTKKKLWQKRHYNTLFGVKNGSPMLVSQTRSHGHSRLFNLSLNPLIHSPFLQHLKIPCSKRSLISPIQLFFKSIYQPSIPLNIIFELNLLHIIPDLSTYLSPIIPLINRVHLYTTKITTYQQLLYLFISTFLCPILLYHDLTFSYHSH